MTRAEPTSPQARWNKRAQSLLAYMPKYFFHLAGEFPAHDLLGHECANDKAAQDHGSFIAHRLGTETPSMVMDNNFVSVTDESGKELFRIPLASMRA